MLFLLAAALLGTSVVFAVRRQAFSWFLFGGIFLAGMAAVGPTTISKLTIKDLMVMERHQPDAAERKLALAASQDQPPEAVLESAAALVATAQKRPPQFRSPEDYLVLATEAWREKRYDDALQLGFSGLQTNPEDQRTRATLMNRLGGVFHDLGDLKMAERYFRRAIEADPAYADPHYNLGFILEKMDRPQDAEAEYREAIELDPQLAEPRNNLGIVLRNEGHLDQAEAQYRECIRIKPDQYECHFNLGSTLEKLGDLKGAEEAFRDAIRVDPKDPDAYTSLAAILHSLHRDDEAQAMLAEARRHASDNLTK